MNYFVHYFNELANRLASSEQTTDTSTALIRPSHMMALPRRARSAEAMKKVGKDGFITVEETTSD
jgi:hypothetical protein